jgi:hypothetical protein
VDLCTGEKVAIKIIKKKKNFMTQAQTEIAILEMLHRHNHIGKNMIGRVINISYSSGMTLTPLLMYSNIEAYFYS